MPERWTQERMDALTDSGVFKVDTQGHRGTTMVTLEEIAAMAGTIVMLRAQLRAQSEKGQGNE